MRNNYTDAIDSEISWFLKHRMESEKKADWNDGFLEGLRQAKRIIARGESKFGLSENIKD